MTSRFATDGLVRYVTASYRRSSAIGRRLVPVLLLALATTACSGTAEWANPTTWWGDSARERAVADAPTNGQDAKVPGADQPYPRLSETPARPQPQMTAEQRREVAQGLVADRANASYSDQQLRAAGTMASQAQAPMQRSVASAPSPAPVQSAATSPPSTMASTGQAQMQSQAMAAPDDDRPMSVPSIVQRHGTWPRPAPSSIEEVTQGRLSGSQQPREPMVTAEAAAAPRAPAVTTAPVDQPPPEPAAPAAAAAAPQLAQASSPPPPTRADLQPPAPPAPPPVDQALIRSLPIGADQAALVESFAARIAEQQAGIAPARGGTVFAAPKAAPISHWQASVPPIVRDSYNQALRESAPAPIAPAAPSSYAAPAAPQRYDMAAAGRGGGQGDAVSPALAAMNQQPVVASNGSLAGLTSLNDIEPGAGGPLMVHFGHGSSRLSQRAEHEVDAIAEAVKSRGLAVRVVGHASQRTGDMPYSRHKAANERISLARANNVARELRRNGVPKELIVVEARGDQDPLYYEFMPEGEAQNRRVEIYLQ